MCYGPLGCTFVAYLQLTLKRHGGDCVADITTGFALIEINRWLVRKADLLDILITHLSFIKRGFIKFQMTQETDLLGHLEMFFLRRLEVAGIAGDLAAIKRLIAKVNFVLETNLLCVLYLLLR